MATHIGPFPLRLVRWGLFIGWILYTTWGPPASARPWSEIQSSGQLRIGVKDNLPPLGFQDPEGTLVGFEIDLAREVAHQLLGDATAVELIPLSNIERLPAIFQDQVDLVIAQVGITPERARQVNFTSPYYIDGTVIAVAQDSGIDTWTGLQNQSIAVLLGSGAIPHLKSALPTVELIPVASYQDGIQLLEAEAVSGIAADKSVVSGWQREDPDYQLIEPAFSSVGLGVVMARNVEAAELTRRVSQLIDRLDESGWLRKTAQEWDLP